VRRSLPLGHPDFGKAFPCRCVRDESGDQRLERLQRFSNLRFYLRLTFDNLIPEGRSGDAANRERFAAATAAAKEFAANPNGWLVFSGPSGCGKSHLAAAIANRCIQQGTLTLFVGTPDLLDHLRAAYRPDSEVQFDSLFEQLSSVPVLVLDDLGGHSATPWAREKLFQLINQRFVAQMPTVFTTTASLDKLDERLQTRLTDPSLSRVFLLEETSSQATEKIDGLRLALLKTMTFKTFDPAHITMDRDDERMVRDAYRHALAFAKEPKDWLLLLGGSGMGKTRLAAAIGNYCREAGRQVLFVIVPDLLDHLRSSFDPQNPAAYDETFEAVKTVPLLILDDLGSQTSTPWADEKLFQLINHRYNALLPTVITTSYRRDQLDSRLVSRLVDGQVSSLLLMGKFDFWGKERAAAAPPGRRTRARSS
jgi:DNA replication protein DnaC